MLYWKGTNLEEGAGWGSSGFGFIRIPFTRVHGSVGWSFSYLSAAPGMQFVRKGVKLSEKRVCTR